MNSTTLDLIREAQAVLCDLPTGGIGPNGATLAEIEEVEQRGAHLEADAVYHAGQKAWLILEQAAKLEETKR